MTIAEERASLDKKMTNSGYTTPVRNAPVKAHPALHDQRNALVKDSFSACGESSGSQTLARSAAGSNASRKAILHKASPEAMKYESPVEDKAGDREAGEASQEAVSSEQAVAAEHKQSDTQS